MIIFSYFHRYKIGFQIVDSFLTWIDSELDPEGSFTGGALQAEDLDRAAQAVAGGGSPRSLEGGQGVLPREFF